MALSDDQKAILRLLAQRGEAGYEDLSALMGIGVDEVHRRARAAAAELESEGIPAPQIPEPPGGGGGDSPSVATDGEAPAGESPPPQAPPTVPSEPQEPAPEIALSSESPRPRSKAEEPKPQSEPAPADVHQHHTLKEDAHRLKLLENRGLWAILAGAAIVVLFVIFVLAGGGNDSDSDGGSASASTDSCKVTAKAPRPSGKTIKALAVAAVKTGKEVTRAVLNPVDGSEAGGLAIFGRVKNSLALQVAAEGLPRGNCGYTIWIAASPQKMLPLASTDVSNNGVINAQVEVPVEVLAYLANETFGQMAITRTDESQLKASLAKATKEKRAPVYTGTEVLRGSVTGPIVGAAKRIEEERKGR